MAATPVLRSLLASLVVMLTWGTPKFPFRTSSGDDCPCRGSLCPCSNFCGHNDICDCCNPDECTGGSEGECCSSQKPICGTYPNAVCCDGVCTGGQCCPSSNGLPCDGNGNCVGGPYPPTYTQCECGRWWSGTACQDSLCSCQPKPNRSAYKSLCRNSTGNRTACVGDYGLTCEWGCQQCTAKKGFGKYQPFCQEQRNHTACDGVNATCVWGMNTTSNSTSSARGL